MSQLVDVDRHRNYVYKWRYNVANKYTEFSRPGIPPLKMARLARTFLRLGNRGMALLRGAIAMNMEETHLERIYDTLYLIERCSRAAQRQVGKGAIFVAPRTEDELISLRDAHLTTIYENAFGVEKRSK